jgi:tetratricopeptide (TPR) repeat protein
MNQNLQRAVLLIQQSRHELAEGELRQSLATEPDDPYAHALMALCLAQREQFKEATAEAEQAIHLGPDFSFAHYAMARVMHRRNREDEALAAIHEAIRLEPFDADYLATLAEIQLHERQWSAALEAAEMGLQIDSEHTGCTNLRAIALVKLGRKAEAGRTIGAALARDPQNAITHANQGWTLLDQGDPKKALEHFREALRLDPDNEWARRGIVEALKARNFVYALMLRYFLAMGKLSRRGQWAVVLGGYMGNQMLGAVARANPALAPWILPLRVLYIAFAIMTWAASPLFNLMLRLNRFGRLALSREQTVASNWIGSSLLLALVFLAGCFVRGFHTPWLVGTLIFGLLVLPLAGTFKCAVGWPRRTMAIYTAVMAVSGIAALSLFFVAEGQTEERAKEILDYSGFPFTVFLLGTVGAAWVANFLIMQRPRR